MYVLNFNSFTMSRQEYEGNGMLGNYKFNGHCHYNINISINVEPSY